MGVRLWGDGFRSRHAAELAGKEALEDFFNGLRLTRHLTYEDAPIERVSSKRMAGDRSSQIEHGFLKQDTETHLAHRSPGVTFVVHASRGRDTMTTVRLSAVSTIAKAQALTEDGWEVSIAGPQGNRYNLLEFENFNSRPGFKQRQTQRI